MTLAAISISLATIRSSRRSKPREHVAFSGSTGKQIDSVNRLLLADAIDPTDPLLQTSRVPWKLEIDDEPAAALKVEAFSTGVGGEKQISCVRP